MGHFNFITELTLATCTIAQKTDTGMVMASSIRIDPANDGMSVACIFVSDIRLNDVSVYGESITYCHR